MRKLLILVLLLVVASMAGWFRINRQGDRTTIEINRTEIRDDARRAISRGREFLDGQYEEYADQQAQQQPQEQVARQVIPWFDGTQWQYYEDPNQVPQNQPANQVNPYQPQPFYEPVTR